MISLQEAMGGGGITLDAAMGGMSLPEQENQYSLPPMPEGLDEPQQRAWKEAQQLLATGEGEKFTPLLEGRAKKLYGLSDEEYAAGVEKFTGKAKELYGLTDEQFAQFGDRAGEDLYGQVLMAKQDPIEQLPAVARIPYKGLNSVLQNTGILLDEIDYARHELTEEWNLARQFRDRLKKRKANRDYDRRISSLAAMDKSWLGQVIEGGMTSAAEFLAVGAATGGGGVVPYLYATSTAEAYTDAKEQGMSNQAAAAYASAEGAGQTAIMAVVGKTIAPGIERMGGKALGPVLARHLGPSLSKLSGASQRVANAAIQGGAESFEEGIQETTSTILAAIAGVEREGSYLDRLTFSMGAGFTGGAPVGVVTASQDFESALGDVRRKAEQARNAAEAAQNYEGPVPPTDREGFKKATKRSKTSQLEREVFAEVVKANRELEQAAQEQQEPAEPQQYTPEPMSRTRTKLREWTNDPRLIEHVENLGEYDVRLPQQVLDLANDFYQRDRESYEASVQHLQDADIDWKYLIKEVRKDQDREVEKIPGYDRALMQLTRQRYGDDFVQDNVNVAAEELRDILDGAEVRFGEVVFPNIAEPPTKQRAIDDAVAELTQGVNQERLESGEPEIVPPAPAPDVPPPETPKQLAESDPRVVKTAIQSIIPGSVAQPQEDGTYRVDLPSGRHFTVKFQEDFGLTDEQLAYNLKAYGIKDTKENREELRRRTEGLFQISTPDGTTVDGLGVVKLLSRLEKSPQRMRKIARHEAFHLARQLGMITDAEFAALRKEYAPGKSDMEAEEAIAQATELWGDGDTSLLSYLKEAFNRLLAKLGLGSLSPEVAKQSFLRGDVFYRTPKAQQQAYRDLVSAQASLSAAWHGSPHTFDEFSLKAMGTGEGAQAYGWGLYFTDSEEVADFYRKKLSAVVPNLERIAESNGVDLSADVNAYRAVYSHLPSPESRAGDFEFLEAAKRAQYASIALRDVPRRSLANAMKEYTKAARGRKYAVDLKPKQDEYLLWDKPLSEQSEKVQRHIGRWWSSLSGTQRASILDDIEVGSGHEVSLGDDLEDATGAEIYRSLVRQINEGMFNNYDVPMDSDIGRAMENGEDSKKVASLMLQSDGIRGIKYLDGTSRSKGEGSYNYVLFDDKDVEIQHVSLSADMQGDMREPGEFPDRYLDRANVSTDQRARQSMSEVDVGEGAPVPRAREEAVAEAEQRLTSDYDWELNKFLADIENAEKNKTVINLNEADVVTMRRLLSDLGIKMFEGDEDARRLHRTLSRGYRDARTEAARALGVRDPLGVKDPAQSPVDRRRNALAEALTEDSPDLKKKRKRAKTKEKRAELDALSDAEWTRLRERLAELGWDLSNIDKIAADPDASTRLLQDASTVKSSVGDMLYEYWKNAILSGPQTHVVNTTGNTLYAPYDMFVERTGEAIVNLFVKDPKGAQLGEFKYLIGGLGPGLKRAARNAVRAWKTESAAFQVEMGRAETEFEQGSRKAIPGKKGRFARIPYRALMFADEFAKSLWATMEVGAQAYRIAKAEGFEGAALEQRISEMVGDIESDAWSLAIDKSTQLTFQGQGGVVSSKLQKGAQFARSHFPGARWVIPFVTTPANIFEAGIRRTPILGALLDFADARQRGHKMADSGMSATLARQAIGLAGLLLLMSTNDPEDPWITGAEDEKDRRRRGTAYRSHPPQSVRIGDRWYSYARIEPFATAIAATVDGIEALRRGDPLGAAITPISQLTTKTYLDGLGDLENAYRQAVRGQNTQERSEGVAEWATNFAGSWIPNIIRQPSRNMREEYAERRVWGKGNEYWRRLAKRAAQGTEFRVIPDEARYDVWGRPIINESPADHPATDLLYRTLTPVRVYETDGMLDIDLALYRWNATNPNAEIHWTPPSPFYREKGDTHYLTDEQYANFTEYSGLLARRHAERVYINPDKPTSAQMDKLDSAVKKGRREARDRLKRYWKRGEDGAELVEQAR